MEDGKKATNFEDIDFSDAETFYDPLEDTEDDTEDDEDLAVPPGYVGDPAELAPKSEVDEKPPETPQEKLEHFFEDMLPYKRNFLAVMDYCQEARSTDQVDAFVKTLPTQRNSVFATASLCQMLAKAGALEKINEDGTPYQEEAAEPETVEDEDGNSYLKPATPVMAFWQITEAGSEYLEQDNPLDDLRQIIAEQERYRPIFRDILSICNTDEGLGINDIKDQINDDPILADPPKTAQFFMDYLERNGALVWDKTWKTTDTGKELLAILQD